MAALAKNCGQLIFSENFYFIGMFLNRKIYIITLKWCIVEQFSHEIYKTKNMKMQHVFEVNQKNFSTGRRKRHAFSIMSISFGHQMFFLRYGFRIFLRILLSYKDAIYDKTISTFSQLLPIYQICVAKRSPPLRMVVFFYSARINIFSQH